MNFSYDDQHHLGSVYLSDDHSAHTYELPKSVIAFVSADDVLVHVETLDTRAWTTDADAEFDEAAAERLVAWTREQLRSRVA